MKKLLTRNLGLKLASLVLAFVLWFLVAQIYDPKDTVTFNNIQVRLINTDLLEQEGKVYEVLDNSNLVRVTVTGPPECCKIRIAQKRYCSGSGYEQTDRYQYDRHHLLL